MTNSIINYINQKTLDNCYHVNPKFYKFNENTFFKYIEKTKYNNFYIFKQDGDFCYTYHKEDNYGNVSPQGDFINQSIVVKDFYKKLDILNENPLVLSINLLIVFALIIFGQFIFSSFPYSEENFID